MTEKQKQIEQMAKVIMGAVSVTIQYVQAPANETEARIEAKALIATGYRKQSDTAREILQMIKDKGLFRYGGYLLHDSDFDTIGKLYGVEVEE